MESISWAIEHPAETMAITIVAGAIAIAAGGLLYFTLAAAARRVRHGGRHHGRSSRAREVLFVGRWGDYGPELFRVGRRVRRLADPGDSGWDAVSFARRILAEVMWQRPATSLARAFAEARLAPLPSEGFVLSSSEVEAWLADPDRSSEPSSTDGFPRTG
jgi:hypothetical protein